jgi:hypothetical protein
MFSPLKSLILIIILGLTLFAPALVTSLEAQGAPARLSGVEKRQLLAIAKEPLLSAIESRPPREPAVGQRLNIPQPVAVSMYLDGKLIARSWELARPGPLVVQVSSLAAALLTGPNYGNVPDPGILSQVKIGVSVFYRFREIKDDRDLGGGEGVVVMSGFREGVGVPQDVPEGAKPADLLSFASVVGGMRPGTWMLPESTLLSGTVDDEREE